MIEEYEKQSRVYFYLSEDNFSCCCQIMSWKERKVKMLKKKFSKTFWDTFWKYKHKIHFGEKDKVFENGANAKH